jgi:bacterioferritin
MSTNEKSYQNKEVLDLLGQIYQMEMAGVSRYLHYSFMIMGYNRIPIQAWFRSNARESMDHATEVGEKITSLGGHPPLLSGKVIETNAHGVLQLLEESLKFEEEAIVGYKKLVKVAADLGDIALEEMARTFVKNEVEHADEVRKMMRKPEGV